MATRNKTRRVFRKGRELLRSLRSKKEAQSTEPILLTIQDQTIEVTYGNTLLACALQADIDLDHYCGGTCSCSTCRIEVMQGGENLSPSRPDEQLVLGPDAEDRGDRLACQARILGPVTIRIPEFFGV